MNADEFNKHIADLMGEADGIATAKRPGYTQASDDVLANFKVAAAQAGIIPMQAWSVYFWKHASAILTYAKDKNIPQAESIKGRFCDAINYLQLGYALALEETRS